MKCPHCLENFHEKWEIRYIDSDDEFIWKERHCTCPACSKIVIELGKQRSEYPGEEWRLVYPKGISRSPIPSEVDDVVLVSDYNEACSVLSDSPKASAALSRRCLQYTLREKARVKPSDLSSEIQEAIDSGKLPADLSESLDNVRVIGNFAAHPIKSKSSGEILGVETGEAEWNLDVVEDLMDFYFVRPARTKARKEALNPKLKEAGKPELHI